MDLLPLIHNFVATVETAITLVCFAPVVLGLIYGGYAILLR